MSARAGISTTDLAILWCPRRPRSINEPERARSGQLGASSAVPRQAFTAGSRQRPGVAGARTVRSSPARDRSTCDRGEAGGRPGRSTMQDDAAREPRRGLGPEAELFRASHAGAGAAPEGSSASATSPPPSMTGDRDAFSWSATRAARVDFVPRRASSLRRGPADHDPPAEALEVEGVERLAPREHAQFVTSTTLFTERPTDSRRRRFHAERALYAHARRDARLYRGKPPGPPPGASEPESGTARRARGRSRGSVLGRRHLARSQDESCPHGYGSPRRRTSRRRPDSLERAADGGGRSS
jgi:hypothetical protein